MEGGSGLKGGQRRRCVLFRALTGAQHAARASQPPLLRSPAIISHTGLLMLTSPACFPGQG